MSTSPHLFQNSIHCCWTTLKRIESSPLRRWLWIFPDLDDSVEYATILQSLAQAQIDVHVLPGWGKSVFSRSLPPESIRRTRLRFLEAPISPDRPFIILSDLAGLLALRTPIDPLLKLAIVPGSILPRAEIRERLSNLGYIISDPVTEPGTYCIRGEILDIFPSSGESPLRVEFFDDRIERVRCFDPNTQLASLPPLSAFTLLPAQEVLIQDRSSLRQEIQDIFDAYKIPNAHRATKIEAFFSEPALSKLELFARFSGPSTSTLHALLPPDDLREWGIILSNASEFSDYWRSFLSDATEQRLRSRSLVPAPVETYDQLSTILNLRTTAAISWEIGGDAIQDPHSEELIAPLDRSLSQDWSWVEPWLLPFVSNGFKVQWYLSSTSRLSAVEEWARELRPEIRNRLTCLSGNLPGNLALADKKIVLLSDTLLFGEMPAKARIDRQKQTADLTAITTLNDLKAGDVVVHRLHGFGRFIGVQSRTEGLSQAEYLTIEYQGGDKLYLPSYRLDWIQRHSAQNSDVQLDRLGGTRFQDAKSRVRKALRALAFDLVQLYAKRKLAEGRTLSLPEEDWNRFLGDFPFQDTPDQIRATREIVADLTSDKIMDRLLCGDVGFGKTEVALRAAFLTAQNGYQTAVLVPTTLLAFQHERSFRARLSKYGIRVESLSRFKSQRQQRDILKDITLGKVDILIGTHRILSKDVVFKDLCLLVLDEEHRFGVEHKERLKTLRADAHVLSMTATPIPRTLQFSLLGIRDISLLASPPQERLPIETRLNELDFQAISDAISVELERDGQVFILVHRVDLVREIAQKVREAFPSVAIAEGHGQMSETALEREVLGFYSGEKKILISTSIIESGIDVSNANTMIIQRADLYGLAQLYQIRGRVGRAARKAYCHLFVPSFSALTEEARARLSVLQKFTELGSGFKVAQHDLAIRGGGESAWPRAVWPYR